MSDAVLEAVRGVQVANPGLGLKPLLARLRKQQPDLEAGTREVREALTALKAESEAREAAAAPPAAAALPTVATPAAATERIAGAEPRLLRLRQAAVRDGRRP